jgi:hypothetical protein
VEAGHYLGKLGKRLWSRLEGVGLFSRAGHQWEDDAFIAAGHGLTDLVKRPTASAASISSDELHAGANAVRAKIREWRPGLVLFAFKGAATPLVGSISSGSGPAIEGVPSFLFTGPYAPAHDSSRKDDELRALLGTRAGSRSPRAEPGPSFPDGATTQPVTPVDKGKRPGGGGSARYRAGVRDPILLAWARSKDRRRRQADEARRTTAGS